MCPLKKVFVKFLQYLLKNIRAVVLSLIKFQAKSLQLYQKQTPAHVLSNNFAKVIKTPIL